VEASYDAFVFDQWGVLHDGNRTYPGVLEVLSRLREAGKPVIILTNSSKSASVNRRRLLERFAIEPDLYTELISSADVMRDMVLERSWSVYVVAVGTDGALFDHAPCRVVSTIEEAEMVALLSVDPRADIDSQLSWIEAACARGIPLMTASADLMTVTPEGILEGISVVVKRFQSLGGRALNVGKPEPLVYRQVKQLLRGVAPHRILAVGDQLWTDVEGANRQGLHSALVATGAAAIQFSQVHSPEEIVQMIKLLNGPLPTWVLPSLRW
jgi:HAD superfamily hydrolase (TIGR01459 family)